jgi:hypothetical protein
MSATFDMTGFEQTMTDLYSAVKQDAGEFVRSEAARLSEECATQLGRRGKGGGEHTIKKDVASVFMPEPGNVFTDHRKDGTTLTWLYATPFDLVGVSSLRDHREDSVQDMATVYYPSLGTMPEARRKLLGNRKTSLRTTKHGHQTSIQRVQEVQRLLVAKSAYRKFVALLMSHKGRLEASFATTALRLRGTVKAVAKVLRNIPSEKNVTNDRTSNASFPMVEFGSTAPGVTKFVPFIQEAIRVRSVKMKARLKYITSGYANAKRRGRITSQSRIVTVVE